MNDFKTDFNTFLDALANYDPESEEIKEIERQIGKRYAEDEISKKTKVVFRALENAVNRFDMDCDAVTEYLNERQDPAFAEKFYDFAYAWIYALGTDDEIRKFADGRNEKSVEVCTALFNNVIANNREIYDKATRCTFINSETLYSMHRTNIQSATKMFITALCEHDPYFEKVCMNNDFASKDKKGYHVYLPMI